MTLLLPLEPLSEVAFVHDYLQLAFQGESYSIYNIAKLILNSNEWMQGDAGFCDALVGLLGQRVQEALNSSEHPLVLRFESGAQLLVLSGSLGARGPEAFQFVNRENQVIVEQNA